LQKKTSSAFYPAFQKALTVYNVRGGFRGAGLVPLDPENVLSKLDVRLRTPTPSPATPSSPTGWISKTPNNPIEATSQTEYIKNRIARHQDSSPTSIYAAIDQLAKGAQGIMHELTLLRSEVHNLRDANQTISKRRRARKNRIQQGGSLTLQDAQALVNSKDVQQGQQSEDSSRQGGIENVQAKKRRCRRCGNTGHNSRTCKSDVQMSSN